MVYRRSEVFRFGAVRHSASITDFAQTHTLFLSNSAMSTSFSDNKAYPGCDYSISQLVHANARKLRDSISGRKCVRYPGWTYQTSETLFPQDFHDHGPGRGKSKRKRTGCAHAVTYAYLLGGRPRKGCVGSAQSGPVIEGFFRPCQPDPP